jgi:hypothetical protein
MLPQTKTTVEIHPHIHDVTDKTMNVSVVRVTHAIEVIQGGFTSIGQARRWINHTQDQPALFD